jgi:hypothetical protein
MCMCQRYSIQQASGRAPWKTVLTVTGKRRAVQVGERLSQNASADSFRVCNAHRPGFTIWQKLSPARN